MDSVRLDKWLWATRLFKTRSEASEACRASAVRLNNTIAKPSSKLRTGDTLVVRTGALTRTVFVLALTEKRVGAIRVPEFLEDRTPEAELEAAREKREHARLFAHRGSGRPTKRDRRELERLLYPEDGEAG